VIANQRTRVLNMQTRLQSFNLRLFYTLLTFCGFLFTQPTGVNPSVKKNLVDKKAEQYRQMLLSRQQQNSNQDAYDILYYALDLTPDPETFVVTGSIEIVGEVITAGLQQVELNFWDGMSILHVHRTDTPEDTLTYTRGSDMLTLDLDRPYLKGEQFRIIVSYQGRPQESPYGSFYFDSLEGIPMIWTLSSVFGARAWWPCKDVPSDKPDSIDIRISVPTDMIAVSNGALKQTSIGNQYTTYWWHEGYPIATYLIFISVYPYEVHYDDYLYNNNADTMKIHFYTFPGNYQLYSEINDKVKDIITFYAGLFGEYPFVDEKYGQVDFLWSGGMEHQTCTSYGRWDEALYAHEIAHQWWGDMITCDSFHHIWLNEGFADYSEAMWFEHLYEPEYTAGDYLMDYQLYLGGGTVYVEHPEYENIFDLGLSYHKASWVLHMLRHVVGENAFFEILRTYYASPAHQYGTATTEDFKAICEDISGIDLDRFFYQWIYEEYFPRYSYSWNWHQEGSQYKVDLQIRQMQDNYIFTMPIDITITTNVGEETFVVQDSLQAQFFSLTVNSEPLNLELDKENWILKIIEESFTSPRFDQGILLVNGVLFEVYGEEIWAAYEDRAFWGEYPVTFWDCFNPPTDGYPVSLPEPLGHGVVPGDVLGRFSTVIWIGNHYSADLGKWQQTSIMPYLENGGNVLLLTRKGRDYLDEEMKRYLGITWAEYPEVTLYNCQAVYPGLQSMPIIGDQNANAVFETTFSTDESTLLFQETASFSIPRGIGVWRKPESGGGQFVFISGRPYRYESSRLRANIEYILKNFFQESLRNLFAGSMEITLAQNFPNPFNHETTISFYLPQPTKVNLEIYDISGRLVRSLIEGDQKSSGPHVYKWDGRNQSGQFVASALYFCRLRTDDTSTSKKLVLIR
jgi:aminopeptidase N